MSRGPYAFAGDHNRNYSPLKKTKGQLNATHDSVIFSVKDINVTIGKI